MTSIISRQSVPAIVGSSGSSSGVGLFAGERIMLVSTGKIQKIVRLRSSVLTATWEQSQIGTVS